MISTHLTFYGNLCDLDQRIQDLKGYYGEINQLIESKKATLALIQVGYHQNTELYNRKLLFENIVEANLRSSVIVSLVTLLEVELQRICNAFKKSLSLKISHSDFKGTIIDQFKLYLTKVVMINYNFGTTEFESIREIIELRNCLVHYEGVIEDFYGRKFDRVKTLKDLNRKFSSIQVIDDEYVYLDKEASLNCINVVEEFLRHIYLTILKFFPEND
nr:hypothetical protein [uncultured Dyadobacter sp.]